MTGPGRPTTGTPVQVRIPPEIIAKLDRTAEYFGITRAALLRRILDHWAEDVR